MNRRGFVAGALLVGLGARAKASTIVREPLEKVLKRTSVALVADVEKVGTVEQKGIWREIGVSFRRVRIIFGKLDGKTVTCRYAEGVPHMRGDARVSPLASGSGQELHLKKGDRVIVLLADPQTLLRIEPLASLALIRPSRPE